VYQWPHISETRQKPNELLWHYGTQQHGKVTL